MTGRIALGRFWKRRAARLLPALSLLLAFCVIAGFPWAIIWPAATYTANIVEASGTGLGALTHTWSLAVEEQFYLLWPLLLAAIPARRRTSMIAVGLMAAITWRWFLLADGASILRVYYGTDTNAMALLAGALLFVKESRGRPPMWWWIAGTALLAASTFQDSAVILWSIFGVVGLSVAAVRQAMHHAPILEWRFLTWLGTISYGLYLWHHVLLWTSLPVGVAVGLSLVVSWGSWRFIEKPILDWSKRSVRPSPDSASDSVVFDQSATFAVQRRIR